LQVIVTTDRALAHVKPSVAGADLQHWVILRAAGFSAAPDASPRAPAKLPVRPWLWIDSAAQIPAQLRGGWKEAQHGS
jgi:hypothetical protein